MNNLHNQLCKYVLAVVHNVPFFCNREATTRCGLCKTPLCDNCTKFCCEDRRVKEN